MGNNVNLHLSPYEAELFEAMWACQNKVEFTAWLKNLDEEDQLLVHRLLERLMLEVSVEIQGTDNVEHVNDAKHLLMKFQL